VADTYEEVPTLAEGIRRHARGRGPRHPDPPPAAKVDDHRPVDDDGQQRIIDLRDVPSRWPTMDGMVNPAPHAWRYEFSPGHLAAVDAFYRDLFWNVQLELDGVNWPGRAPDRNEPSILAACRDVARLWRLPSAEEPLPSTTTARQVRNRRRREPKPVDVRESTDG
jgi:hypothetical protein